MNHLLIAHPNTKGTGSAVRFELHPAEDGREGMIVGLLATQIFDGETYLREFDWQKAIRIILSPLDVAQILEVLRGYHESIGNGKGLFHCNVEHNTVIRFLHLIEPSPAFQLHITRRYIATGSHQEIKIAFTMPEAIVLGEVFASSLVRMTFG